MKKKIKSVNKSYKIIQTRDICVIITSCAINILQIIYTALFNLDGVIPRKKVIWDIHHQW